MTLFRLLLAAMLITLVVYTVIVMANHGFGLIPIFFGDIAAMTWPGQFNLDFSGFLVLSALWTAWRNNFSALGLALSPLALFGGMMFLLIYLLILTTQTKGDMKVILMGRSRADA